ncbi:MAG: acyltransferase family protein [Methylophilus sp.]
MTERDSIAIKICRILCIFFMTYVHVNPSPSNWEGASKFLLFTGHLAPGELRVSVGNEAPQYLFNIANILAQILGRASVPALSVIGGFLAVAAYQRRSKWLLYAKERFQTLIIPLITWNVIIIALSLVILLGTGAYTDTAKKLLPFDQITFFKVLDLLVAFKTDSVTTALTFLRDIFVCSLLVPLLMLAFKRLGIVALITIWLMGLTIGFAPIILRNTIILFFASGVYLALHSDQLIPTRSVAFKLVSCILLAMAIIQFTPAFSDVYGGKNLTDISVRLVVVPLFLIAAIALSSTVLGHRLAKLEPYAYLLFLSHSTIMLVFWGAWQIVFGKGAEWPYVIFYVMAPFASLAVVIMLHKIISFMPSFIQLIFNGKKIFLKSQV